jgi:hypothetical protein
MESGMKNALSKHETIKRKRLNEADESEFISEICMASEEKETYNCIRAYLK